MHGYEIRPNGRENGPRVVNIQAIAPIKNRMVAVII
jgi:hypothetical protein